ncbi:3-deoxy-manno-octulosonate cytidylyltransferase [Cereibacter changlensis JA139]|uniref:3-deoxy-manno-octulosonate cytidylyltransferase n=2 Tax=Cereibacter changlensis TaxID=402884 RepID=A0A2T4K112_9RHOB|nr:manno-octulosonate cytidylyltransferase [Cereibacter changlensis]PTE23733.1 3-deoxy-manno-octulosonate cytidylyltransferase [Cereibacter changlensis JA139]PZX59062.1 3-deoxy-manno-octulosonate cytidylyltransferase (CMP-KDO synthetase) [Cereibacter changlensis]
MSVLIAIPARYASTRYPGKPLVALRGADGVSKTLIQRSWEAAMAVKGVDRVVVATDDDRIREAAEGFGAEVVMTSSDCQNGTERCAEVLDQLGGFDMVVNLQGDAPLTPAWFVEDLIAGLDADAGAEVATPVLRCDGRALNGFLADRRAGRVGGTTAVFGADRRALYFSKEVIPYTGKTYADDAETPVFHHVGVYAYRPSALAAYRGWAAGPLEGLEGLEQLRFLERERPVLCVEVEARGRQFWELNNPEDVARIEAMMAEMQAG